MRLLPLALVALAACADAPPPATDTADASGAEVLDENAIAFRDAFVRAAPAGGTSAAYLQIENGTDTADTLVAIRTDAAGRAEVHQTGEADGLRTMDPVEGGLPVGSGQTVILEPGGLHVMLLDLQRDLSPGDSLLLELDFAGRGTLTSRVPVRGLGPDA